MATQLTNYQCPACTGPLHFSAASGRLECEFCGTAYEPAEIERLYAEKDKAAAEAKTAAGDDWGAEGGMQTYNCPSCGAELLCDGTTAATSCPYCGNPNIIPGQFTGARRPDYIIPFKLDKAAAVAALKAHYRGKPLLPKSFRDKNHIEELKGVYVPFWLFDGEADADLRFAASRSFTRREGSFDVTTTEHYDVRRAGTVAFRRVPVDGSSKMPDAHMDSIEPFDYNDLIPFSTAYMPGFLADKYDVEPETDASRVEERMACSAIDCMEQTVGGYDSCHRTGENVSIRRGEPQYALLPVWMLNTNWNGKKFLFAMNGQTGRLIGDLPVSRGRYWAWFGSIAGALTAVLTFLLMYTF